MEKNYKSIYKCRLCGKQFDGESCIIFRLSDFPTAPVLKQHKCEDGRYGCGDFLGAYDADARHERKPEKPQSAAKEGTRAACEYCQGKGTVISSVKQFKDRIEMVVGGVDGNKLKVSTMIQTAGAIPPPAFAEAEIEYCPKCGRRLSE